MHLSVTFRHMHSTMALEKHVLEKVKKLSRYGISLHDIHVVLSKEKFRHECEVIVRSDHFHAESIEVSENLYVSIDRAVNKVVTQLKRHHQKIKTHKNLRRARWAGDTLFHEQLQLSH